MTFRLPATLNRIADAAGEETALLMALELGGRRIRIPQKSAGSDLAEVIGIEAADKLVAEMADERIEIPQVKKILAVWLARERGWSQEHIANRLKSSRRAVQYWLSGNTPERQPDLFDEAS